jgi:hypothetical protein
LSGTLTLITPPAAAGARVASAPRTVFSQSAVAPPPATAGGTGTVTKQDDVLGTSQADVLGGA